MREANFTARIWTAAFIAIVAPWIMAPDSCTPTQETVKILSPVDGATALAHSAFFHVEGVNVDGASVAMKLDGVDRTAELTRTINGATTTLQGTLLVSPAGPHAIEASGTGSSGVITATSGFTLSPPAYYTPDEIILGAVTPGNPVTVRGNVTGATFTTATPSTRNSWRYFLLEVTNGAGLSQTQLLWGVGARLSATQLQVERIAIPYPGDVVEVAGTLTQETFGAEQRFVLNPVTSVATVSSPNPVLADIGEACTHDISCRDDLFCNRTTLLCETGTPISWGGDPRGVNGACDDDSDCPAGQFCEPGYTIESAAVDEFHGAHISAGRDVGRNLCQVPDRNAPTAEICPRAVTVDDLMSGRFIDGKEICVEDRVFLCAFNPGDYDTHCQLFIQKPLLYPVGDPPIVIVQSAFENAPPYKDPDNPQGALGDMPPNARLVTTGTVKWDSSHEWYEVHPYKWWRAVP
ncbi:MAG: hypothetical protein KC466_11050 [Myxococcales bacterium]|nr:hypothetical protein [Myxococcales bacterium]